MNIERIVTQTANLKNNVAETIAKEAGETIKQAAESKITKAAALGIVASATGVMLANNAKDSAEDGKKKIRILKSLGLNDETVDKVLSLKDSNNNTVFNSKKVTYLGHTSKMNDTTFFNYAMKNVDYITYFNKTKIDEKETRRDGDLVAKYNSPLVAKYNLVAETPEGLKKIEAAVDKDGRVHRLNIEEQNKDGTTLNKAKYIDFSDEYFDFDWREFSYTVKDGKVISREGMRKEAGNNRLVKEIYTDDDGFKNIIAAKNITITPKGVIDKITESKYEYDSEGNTAKKERIDIDYKNNKAKTVVHGVGPSGEVKELERTVKNPLTGKVEIQRMKLSDVKGVYNSVIIDENGNEKVESLGRVNPDGSTYVEKNLESLDGVKTHYVREASKNEDNIKTFYQITDNDGKVLTTVDRTFKRISPTKAYSSINGHGYSIEKQEKAYVVTDLASQKTYVMKNKDLFKNNESRKHPEMIDKMSGDMLIDMYNRGYKYRYIPESDTVISYAKFFEKTIEAVPNLFTFAHEQGHTKDAYIDLENEENSRFTISTNPLFKEEFEKERKQFVEAFSGIQQDFIDYFIAQIYQFGGPEEAIAETNAMFSTETGRNTYGVRTHYLQKYFPRSIAAASYLLNPNSNLYVQNS